MMREFPKHRTLNKTLVDCGQSNRPTIEYQMMVLIAEPDDALCLSIVA